MKCPGQDSRFWKPSDVFEMECPECGNPLEFFKDEPALRCRKCKHKVVNPKMDFGCAAYCKYADQCLGELPPELLAQRKELLKDRVAIEMKRHYRQDFKRIGHATKVARYAERIAREEKGDLAVVLCAAYLHDVGTEDAADHEETGVAVAREILEKLDAGEELTNEVCKIIGHHHHPAAEETINFKAVYDGDLIVNMEERNKESPRSPEALAAEIEKSFLTESGRRMARSALIPEEK